MLNDLKSDKFMYIQDNYNEINTKSEEEVENCINKNIEDNNLIQQESIEKNEE